MEWLGARLGITRKQLGGEIAWFLWMLLMYWAVYSERNRPAGDTSLYTGLVVFQMIGCGFIAKSRGRTAWWCLVGLLPLVCVGLPFLLPHKDAAAEAIRPSPLVRIAAGFGTVLLAFGWIVLVAGSMDRPGARLSPVHSWSQHEIGDLRVEVPSALRWALLPLDKVPAEQRERCTAIAMEKARNAADDFAVSVCSYTLKPDYVPTLDGFLEPVLQATASALGAASPEVFVVPARVGTLEARRARCIVTSRHVPAHLQALVVIDGQTTWYVLVVCSGNEAVPDLERVLSSVSIAPAAAPR